MARHLRVRVRRHGEHAPRDDLRFRVKERRSLRANTLRVRSLGDQGRLLRAERRNLGVNFG